MIKEMVSVFGSKTKAQEMLLLLNDAKEVVRQGFYPEELEDVEDFCQRNRIYMAKSKFKIILSEDEYSYSNKGFRVPDYDASPGMFFCYFSKEEKSAMAAAYFELVNDNYHLGLLLGYPECCVKFFCNSFGPKNPNLELNPTNLYTNLSLRNKDVVILSHFPCSSKCQESINLAQRYLHILDAVYPERANELKSRLEVM